MEQKLLEPVFLTHPPVWRMDSLSERTHKPNIAYAIKNHHPDPG